MDILQMSCKGSVIIILITIIRALFINNLPKRTFLLLWCVALFKLLIPFSLPFAFNIYSLMEVYADSTVPGSYQARLLEDVLTINDTAGHKVLENVTGQLNTQPINYTNLSIWNIIWALGLVLFIAFFAAAYIKSIRKFKESLPVANEFVKRWLDNTKIKRIVQIRESECTAAPLTYGIINPVILVPKIMDWSDEEQAQFILMHELTHIKRFDVITKLILAFTICLHWFNPFVWVMYILFNRDIEFACDEEVVMQLGERKKSAYASTLINMEESKAGLMPFCNSFSKNAIEERITAIMKTKKSTIVTIFVACVIVLGTILFFATSSDKGITAETSVDLTGEEIQDNADTKRNEEELRKEYESHGISYDENDKMLFNGELVRYFYDGVEVEKDSYAVHYEYLNESGTADVYTVRGIIDNGDGSINPFGELISIEKYSQSDFDKRDIAEIKKENKGQTTENIAANNADNVEYEEGEAETYIEVTANEGISKNSIKGVTFTEKFSKYREYGIEYIEAENASGAGDVYYNNILVKTFIDQNEKGIFTYDSKSGGTIKVQAVYNDKNELCGVKEYVD